MLNPAVNAAQVESTVPDSGRWLTLAGIALGTRYQITYLTDEPGDYDLEIALLLRQFSQALSIFEPDSDLSRFNRTGSFRFESPFFYPVLRASAEVFALTNGAFDPTVGPLVEAYGFGRAGRSAGPFAQVDGLVGAVGFGHIQFDEERVVRSRPDVQLNFNAIAKGYAVDIIGQFLEARGIERYLIELGGEVRGRGCNPHSQPWRIGIINPQSGDEWHTVLPLIDQSLATSGNYRNCYEQNGIQYRHLIDPQTGQMTPSDLLSVTVVAQECMTADALATAFMVMGVRKTINFLGKHPQYQAHLLLASTPRYEL